MTNGLSTCGNTLTPVQFCNWRKISISLGSRQFFALFVHPAGVFFDRVMGFKNRANGRNNRRSGRRHEQRGQSTVIEPQFGRDGK